jgi:hypothetical protein
VVKAATRENAEEGGALMAISFKGYKIFEPSADRAQSFLEDHIGIELRARHRDAS